LQIVRFTQADNCEDIIYSRECSALSKLNGHLFKIIDNVRYRQFDGDIVLFNEDSYYHTGNGQVMNQIENNKNYAIIDENSEMEIL
jgi:hypothetical protein